MTQWEGNTILKANCNIRYMVTVIRETKPIARSQYECMASLFIREGGRPDYFRSIQDYRDYIIASRKSFKINKGDRYLYQVNVSYGDFYTFRAIPEIHAICIKYDLYPN